jgi:hypothetical protein
VSVTKIGHDQWHSSEDGRTFDSELAALHYDAIEAQKREAEKARQETDLFDGLSSTQVKHLVDRVRGEALDASGAVQTSQDADLFVQRHPEYVNDDKNASRMLGFLAARGRNKNPTIYDLEAAYEELTERNVLILNPEFVPKQVEKEPPFDEAAAYNLPIAELEARARGWK